MWLVVRLVGQDSLDCEFSGQIVKAVGSSQFSVVSENTFRLD